MKTHQALNKLSKCANMRYCKNQVLLWFYHQFTMKTKKNQHTILEICTKRNSLQNLTRFHGGLFELEIPESFTRAFLFKTIIWT